MINHDHKFIFIHNNRTGGTSVEYFFTQETEVANKHFFPLDWIKHFPKEWETYFKFSIVRNPWDKVLSQWALDKKRYGDKGFSKTFKEFVKYPQGFPLRPQLHFLSDPKCVSYQDIVNYVESNIDYIMKFEALEQDFDKLCNKLGVLNAGLPHKYSSTSIRQKTPYQEYYDDETRDIVARIYDIDIKYFGYRFTE